MYHTPVIPSIRVRNFTRKTNQLRHALAPPQEFIFSLLPQKFFAPSKENALQPLPSCESFSAPLPQKTLLSLLPFCGKFFFCPLATAKYFLSSPLPVGKGGYREDGPVNAKGVSSSLRRCLGQHAIPTVLRTSPLKQVLRGAEVAPQPKVLQKKRTSAEYADAPCLERRQQPILPGR